MGSSKEWLGSILEVLWVLHCERPHSYFRRRSSHRLRLRAAQTLSIHLQVVERMNQFASGTCHRDVKRRDPSASSVGASLRARALDCSSSHNQDFKFITFGLFQIGKTRLSVFGSYAPSSAVTPQLFANSVISLDENPANAMHTVRAPCASRVPA